MSACVHHYIILKLSMAHQSKWKKLWRILLEVISSKASSANICLLPLYLPLNPSRILVAANMKDPNSMLFVSQSINYPYDTLPFIKADTEAKTARRNLTKLYNTYGIQVLSSYEKGSYRNSRLKRCTLVSFNSLYNLPLPWFMNYMINAKVRRG
jgi:hypothetical protein